MANFRTRQPWRPRLSRRELLGGWVFFSLFVLVFPYLMAGVQWILDQRWGLYLSDASAAVVYYGLLAAAALLLFWNYLKQGFFLLLDWLPENLRAMGSGFLIWLVLGRLAALIPLPVEDPTPGDYAMQFLLAPGATTAILVLLMPLVEEILFRGLLFGSLRGTGRALAWSLSVLLFALYGVWQLSFAWSDWRYLLLALRHLPAGLALTWAYDRGGSVWSPVFLRMLIGGVSLYTLVTTSSFSG